MKMKLRMLHRLLALLSAASAPEQASTGCTPPINSVQLRQRMNLKWWGSR